MRINNSGSCYELTDDDMKSYQRILNATYDLDIRSGGEKGISTHVSWKVFAPAKDRTYYTATGDTLTSAVNMWFDCIREKGTEPFFSR